MIEDKHSEPAHCAAATRHADSQSGSSMTPERWEQVKRLFEAAQELSPAERAPFLNGACPDDPELRNEVESLLSGDRHAGDFLEKPILAEAAETENVAIRVGTLSLGQVLSGRFRVIRFLGQGGMGEVYEARDLDLGERVALKTIRPEIASQPLTMARFKQEIQLARRVTHPNVCRMFDLGRHRPPPANDPSAGVVTFLTMELLEGETLAARLRRVGRMTTAEALPLVQQMAEALAAAHDVGVVHRDFKPGNVMLVPAKSGDGKERAVVTDFGLAKAVVAAEQATSEGPASAVTASGHMIGTLAYIAPEQLQGCEATTASDIYALGLVMYEMVAGKHPFPSDALFGGAYQRLTQPPPSPRVHVPDLDPQWEQAIMSCLEVDPGKRFASARSLAVALSSPRAVAEMPALERGEGSSSPLVGTRAVQQADVAASPATAGSVQALKGSGATPSGRTAVGTLRSAQGQAPPLHDSEVIAGLVQRHQKTIIALAAGMVIAAALIYNLYRAASHAPASPAALGLTRVTGSGDVRQADISPDGKYVAFVRQTAGGQSLWLKQLATDSDVQIATLGEDQCPGLAFSPDGSYVYFVRQKPLNPNGDLYQVPALGGSARRMLAGISGPPTFSPDGQRIAFVRETIDEFSLLTASLDGSGERTLAPYKETEWMVIQRVAWSPDGKTLAFAHFRSQGVLTTIGAEGGPARPVAGANWNWISDFAWLPGSRHLIVAGIAQGESGTVATLQLYEESTEGGKVRQITHDLSRYTGVRASADGKTLLALQNQVLATLQVARPGKESEARTLSAGNQNGDGDNGLAWTPDGKIVYCSVHNGRYDLWEMGSDGSNPQRLTNNDTSSGSYDLVVSPRGDFVAFVQQDRSNRWNIWRVDMDGTNLKQLTQGRSDGSPTVSPDGQWVVFSRDQGGKVTLMKVPSGGGPATQLTDYNSIWPSVSPDGKWIAFGYSPGQNQPVSIAVVPFAGGQPAKVFPLPATSQYPDVWTPAPLIWTPDGHAISFLNSANGVNNIWEQPVTGGPPKPVTHFTSDNIFSFDWSRDGRLALSRGTDTTDAVLIKNFR